ncbi:TadE/TadG family type IV pilus assembly protein [Massilia sp.]|uniref:TadE/TadG family type IV pilus assembly protein n=1 Tax=Massilia sp. TaxID=1882437 RepID=UPI00391D3D6A
MRRKPWATGRQYEEGAIAVETAIVLPILLLFFALPSIVFAFYFRQYSAAYKAAHDAAIYLSTAPTVEFTTPGPDGEFAALTVARNIVAKELAGVVPKGVSVQPSIGCLYRVGRTPKARDCTPQAFSSDATPLIRFDVEISLPFINPLTGQKIASMAMGPIPSMPYMGN